MASISRPREQAVTNDAAEQQQIDRIGNPAAAAIEIGGHHDGERSGRQHEVRHRASGRGQRQEGEEQNPQKIDGGFVGARPHRAAAPLKQAEDAVLVDTTDLSFEESVEKIISLIRRAL